MKRPVAQPRPRRAAPAAAARAPRAPRRGFTLGELVVSLALVSVLLVAMGSVLVVAARAVGVSATHAGEAKADDAVAAITSEHRFALSITEHTPTAITFTVPDRDNDQDVETIRYAWSGVPGDPLTRQYNGALPVVVVPDVRHFQLHYLTRVAAPPPAAELESPEERFLVHAPDSPTPSPNPNYNVAVSTTLVSTWCAQYFKPTFPADRTVTSYQITKVIFRPAKSTTSTSAYWNCQVWPASDAMIPAGGAVNGEKVQLMMSSLSSSGSQGTASVLPAQYQITFSNATGLDPTKGACFVVAAPGIGTTGVVCTERNGPSMTAGTHFITSSTSGLTWSTPGDAQDMYIEVWGKYRYLAE